MEKELRVAAAKAAHAREANSLAQEHTESQLGQCRRQLVARTEQLLRIDEADTAGDVQGRLAEAAAEIADELRREREARQCAVCLRSERATVLLPCHHNVMCAPCTRHVEASSARCPLCRQGIESSFRVFT